MKTILILFSVMLSVNANRARFDNYRVYSLSAKTNEQVQILQQIESETSDGYLFWNSILVGRPIDLMVAPHKFGDFIDLMKDTEISYALRVENVQT